MVEHPMLIRGAQRQWFRNSDNIRWKEPNANRIGIRTEWLRSTNAELKWIVRAKRQCCFPSAVDVNIGDVEYVNVNEKAKSSEKRWEREKTSGRIKFRIASKLLLLDMATASTTQHRFDARNVRCCILYTFRSTLSFFPSFIRIFHAHVWQNTLE